MDQFYAMFILRNFSSILVFYARVATCFSGTAASFSYKGCFANYFGHLIHEHYDDQSIYECARLATAASKPFFGMEYPQGSSEPGRALCLLLDTLFLMSGVDDSDCEVDGFFNGYRLGGSYRLAAYVTQTATETATSTSTTLTSNTESGTGTTPTFTTSTMSMQMHSSSTEPIPALGGTRIAGTMDVHGVDYSALNSNPSLRRAFETTCKITIASAANTAPENVEVTLSAGSVKVDYMIEPSTSFIAVAGALTSAIGHSLGADLATEIASISGIDDVVSGSLVVTQLLAPTVTHATETPAPSDGSGEPAPSGGSNEPAPSVDGDELAKNNSSGEPAPSGRGGEASPSVDDADAPTGASSLQNQDSMGLGSVSSIVAAGAGVAALLAFVLLILGVVRRRRHNIRKRNRATTSREQTPTPQENETSVLANERSRIHDIWQECANDEANGSGNNEALNNVSNLCFEDMPAESHQAPIYWIHKDMTQTFVELQPVSYCTESIIQTCLQTTYRNFVTRDRQGGRMPSGFRIVEIQRLENRDLWKQYARNRFAMKMKYAHGCTPVDARGGVLTERELARLQPELERSVNEILLWHGASPAVVRRITKEGVGLPYSGEHTRSVYGKGLYFAESSSRSDENAQEIDSGPNKGLFYLLLCRVVLGEQLVMAKGGPASHSLISEAVNSGLYESVLGDRAATAGKYRDFVVYDDGLAYPEYLVTYKRIYDEASLDIRPHPDGSMRV